MFLQDLEEDPEFRSQINIYEEASVKEVIKMDQQILEENGDDDWESIEEMPGIQPGEFVTEGKEPEGEDGAYEFTQD